MIFAILLVLGLRATAMVAFPILRPDPEEIQIPIDYSSTTSPFDNLTWLSSSESRLFEARHLKVVRKFVEIPFGKLGSSSVDLYTVTAEAKNTEEYDGIPVVLVHGYAGGVAQWTPNLAHLVQNRTVHAFDLPGWARSSRPKFSEKSEEIEKEYVNAIEEWRKAMGIEKMHLIGHSFGGYLSSVYALQHPTRIAHLILSDPWGYNVAPWWNQAIGYVIKPFSPLFIGRLAGSMCSSLLRLAMPQFSSRYPSSHANDIYDYSCETIMDTPTGEDSFIRLMDPIGIAKHHLEERILKLDESIPISFIVGASSIINDSGVRKVEAARNSVVVESIVCGSHHEYSEHPAVFNALVDKALLRPMKVEKADCESEF